MKRKNLLLATIVALSMSATSVAAPLSALNLGAQTVYAGVIKRNVTSKSSQTTSAATTDASSDASTNQQETSIGTAASSDGKTYTEVDSNGQIVKQQDLQDGASKYAISTYHGKTYSSDFHPVSGGYIVDDLICFPLINLDGSPRKMKLPVIYPIEVYKTSDWLFPNGVAKTPGYLSAELQCETASYDDRMKWPIKPAPGEEFHYAPQTLYRTDYSTENHPWPEVNPITEKPLWDTQPFWRSDNSFDLYGYLKQFTPEYALTCTEIGVDETGYDRYDKQFTLYGSGIGLVHANKDWGMDPEKWDPAHSLPIVLYISLANSRLFDKGYRDKVQLTNLGGVHFHGNVRKADGTWMETEALAEIEPGYEGRKIRITGTTDAYINETVLKALEMIMHSYVDDHSFSNVVGDSAEETYVPILDHDQDKARIRFSKVWFTSVFGN